MYENKAVTYVKTHQEIILKYVSSKNISIYSLLNNRDDTGESTMYYEELFLLWTEYLYETSTSLHSLQE